jgi:hypothetical protein
MEVLCDVINSPSRGVEVLYDAIIHRAQGGATRCHLVRYKGSV